LQFVEGVRTAIFNLMWIDTLKQARRVIIGVIGFTVVLLGVVMIVTPGPGWLVILLGLSILSAEFVWARRLMKKLKQTGKDLTRSVFGETRKVPQRE
jgi:uncharacterized protein (TIGR02611 family)